MPPPPTPEWSRKVAVDKLGQKPSKTILEASEQECRDLARRLRVEGIEKLSGEIILQRQPGGHVIAATGTVKATVRQLCVTTLKPLSNKITADIEAWFSDEAQAVTLNKARRERATQRADTEVQMLEEGEDPETVDADGMLDLGELAAQFLSLAVDPFPRSAAAAGGETELPAAGRPNPFAALKDWKTEKDRG